MEKKTVLVVFGGLSREYAVSCQSAATVLRHINREDYHVISVGITQEGKWFKTQAAPQKVEQGQWDLGMENEKVFLCMDGSSSGLGNNKGEIEKIDCVFPVLHGKFGEDGTIQGLLELAKIPYVGSGVLASSMAMDKSITKAIVDRTNVKQAKYYAFSRHDFSRRPGEILDGVEEFFSRKYPLFVKPSNSGSSIGVSKVENSSQLPEAIKIAAREDEKIIVEEQILGRELEIGLLGNQSVVLSPIGEILSGKDFYDYEAKYEKAGSKTVIVEDLSTEKVEEIQNAALEVYKALGCKGLARADFFLSREGTVIFNEINTMPGFTEISMYPSLWHHWGLDTGELIDRLLKLAMEER